MRSSISSILVGVVASAPCTPEQFFINYADSPSQMRISWATSCSATAAVSYGLSPTSLTQSVTGPAPSRYTAPFYTSPYIYHVTLNGLEEDTVYFYRVGDRTSGASPIFNFTSHPGVGPSLSHKFAVIGDPGQTSNSASTFGHVAASASDSIMIVGDLSYADSDQPRWDSWQSLVAPLTSHLPTMVQVGNHEKELTGFDAYAARFAMPAPASGVNNVWYSVDIASAHWICLSNYHPFTSGSEQYDWLKSDLLSINRTATPWVLINTHAPWYSTNSVHQGDGEAQRQALEAMLYASGVDAVFTGHVHAYERSHRVFNKQRDAKGPMHVTVGDGGNREGLYPNWLPQTPVSAFRAATYGHGELSIFNETHALWAWHANPDSEAKVEDSVWLIKGQDA